MAERWLAVDPGEDTGLSIWEDDRLVDAHTIKLWAVADLVYAALSGDLSHSSEEHEDFLAHLTGENRLVRIVCEDWRIYPWEAKNLAWDQCRTARLIGALTFLASTFGIEFVLQGAKIKERAVNGGAQEFFYKPLHENRHQNDSIMHGWYYIQTEMKGQPGNQLEQDEHKVVAHHPV